jgi:hypothetical protein
MRRTVLPLAAPYAEEQLPRDVEPGTDGVERVLYMVALVVAAPHDAGQKVHDEAGAADDPPRRGSRRGG